MKKPRIHMGDNHSSWDEAGWIWFMAACGDAYCVIRIPPGELIRLRETCNSYVDLMAAVEDAASGLAPVDHPTFNKVFSIGEEPTTAAADVLPDWLATLYFVDPAEGPDAKSQWRASGSARAMVQRALTWDENEFQGAYLMANAGLLYNADAILQIARKLKIERSASANPA